MKQEINYIRYQHMMDLVSFAEIVYKDPHRPLDPAGLTLNFDRVQDFKDVTDA
jgi:hypothetical protein